MSEVMLENVQKGKVINYMELCGPSSSKVKALVQVGTCVVDVNFEFLQYEFVRSEHPIGSHVGVAFYGGEWHFQSEQSRPGFGIMKALENMGRHASSVKKELAGPSPSEQWEASIKVDLDGDLDYIKNNIGTFELDVDPEADYIRQVEMDFTDRADDVLERLDLSYLRIARKAVKCN
jgi:hypothetical protein